MWCSEPRPRASGRMVTIGTQITDFQKTLAVARGKCRGLFAALGIHPHYAAETEEGYEGFSAELHQGE